MARQRHTMATVPWTLLAAGSLALLPTLALGSITARFTVGFAYGVGLLVLLADERIIAGTPNRPEARPVSARQASTDR
ncbi:hypothetical protein [Spirillospora sp. CA-128828]|uniref:hypothetical protein n=1 Tax=Spirillospora sp. CA-128828 TaxID=3240033 RepID=UPI003D94F0B7